MSASLRISAGHPGEAIITLIGQAIHHGQSLNIAFPQFASIPVQQVIEQRVQGDDLLLIMDADSLGDILEAGSPCQIKIPELNIVASVIWPEIVGRRSQGRRVVDATIVKSKPLIMPVEPEIKEEVKSEIVEKPSLVTEVTSNEKDEKTDKKEPILGNSYRENRDHDEVPLVRSKSSKKTWIPILSTIVIVCLITAGGVSYYMKNVKKEVPIPPPNKEKTVKTEPKKDEKPVPVNPLEEKHKTEQTPVTPSLPPPETLEKMSVADVINKAPSTAMITKEGERRLMNKQPDDGVLLLENASSKGDAVAMLKLGMLYDPVNFKEGGPIPSPDMREAARYFQKAVNQGSKDAEVPRASLHDWLTKKAEAGDEMAKLTLKDFWP